MHMTPEDIELRNESYRLFVALGQAPSPEEVGAATASTPVQVRRGWRRLHHDHALVLNQAGSEIRMANPFSAVPTAYRVLTFRSLVVRPLRLGRVGNR